MSGEPEVPEAVAGPDASLDGGAEPSDGRPPRNRRRIVIVGAVVAAVAIVVLALALFGVIGGGGSKLGGSNTPPTLVRISVLTLNFSPSNNSCLLTEYQSTHAQTVVAGGSVIYNLSVQNSNPGGARGCEITGLAVGTGGFSLAGSNAPLSVGSGPVTLTFTLGTPSTTFNGSVTVTANVTFQTPDIHVENQNYSVTGGSGECGEVSASGIGFSAFDSSTYSDSALVISISPATICSITQISLVASQGFSISGTNLPVQLPIDNIASVTFTLHLPTTSFQGSLNYTLTLS